MKMKIEPLDLAKWVDEKTVEIHKNSIEKGWWESGERPLYEIKALVHSEISEATEEARVNKMKTYYNEGSKKPEGYFVELADAFIRIFDYMGKYEINYNSFNVMNTNQVDKFRELSNFIEHSFSEMELYPLSVTCDFHDYVSSWQHAPSEPEFNSSSFKAETFAMLIGVIMLSDKYEVDFIATIEEKNEYNKTRPHRHGGKLY